MCPTVSAKAVTSRGGGNRQLFSMELRAAFKSLRQPNSVQLGTP